MPYSLIHCKTIRTGIHKGNPLCRLLRAQEDFIILKRGNGLPQPLHGFAMTGEGKRIAARLVALAMTENGEKRIATAVTRLRNDGEWGETDC